MGFETNVFVNCPFDDQYRPILRPIIFVIVDLGMTPRITTESLNSGKARIGKILKLIEELKYAIHDLSRLQAEQAGEYYRMNMPFELGVDVGCQLFGQGNLADKRCLILEAERYRYQAALSDMSNSDIEAHRNEPELAAKHVRNWLNNEARLRAPGPKRIWSRFEDFMAANYVKLTDRGYSPEEVEGLTIPELIEDIQEWISGEG